MNSRPVLLPLTLIATLLGTASGQEYEARIHTNAAGLTLPYRLLVPHGYAPAQRYPLVLLLHGAGERGSDNQAQLVHGTKLYLDPANRAKYPAFVLVPQCPTGQRWVEMAWDGDRGTQPAEPSPPMRLVLDLLEVLPREFSLDPQRLYVTGLSMGGYGTWDLITRFPGRFAAAAPICGGGDDTVAARAVRTPIWAFHSDDDGAVPVARTRNMIAALRAAGGTPRYFEYWGLGHNSWDRAYSEPEFLPWMFAQRLGQPDTFTVHAKVPEVPRIGRLPDSDDGLPGVGPLRRYDWFRLLWRQKRLAWSERLEQDRGAVVFIGDSITQGWGDNLGDSFPGLKVANRGISGDTSRGVLYRLKEDVLALDPRAVVLLVGTNDLEENAQPETVIVNVRLILAALKALPSHPPVVLCKAMPSSATMRRPAPSITRLNELLSEAAGQDPQFRLCDTWSIFADPQGDAKKEEFPDLLHPNAAGYQKWAAALRPILTDLKLLSP